MRVLIAIFSLILPFVGYWLGIVLCILTRQILATVNWENPIALDLIASFLFVCFSSRVFLAVLAYYPGSNKGDAYNTIFLVCLLLIGILLSMSIKEGFVVTVSFMDLYVLLLLLAVTGFPGWNVSLLLVWTTLWKASRTICREGLTKPTANLQAGDTHHNHSEAARCHLLLDTLHSEPLSEPKEACQDFRGDAPCRQECKWTGL